MFTGIVQAIGKIVSMSAQPSGVRLVVNRNGWRPDAAAIDLGNSICVSGVCLTVAAFDDQTMQFDVTAETLARSTLARLAPGSSVNLEPSLTPATPLGGHFVQGHVDGIATVNKVETGGNDCRIGIQTPPELRDQIVPKGSIAVDGVSLTVAAIDSKGFEVAMIPTTLQMTTLGSVTTGTQVNLETDIISKTIVHWLRSQTKGGQADEAATPVTMETLYRSGIAR